MKYYGLNLAKVGCRRKWPPPARWFDIRDMAWRSMGSVNLSWISLPSGAASNNYTNIYITFSPNRYIGLTGRSYVAPTAGRSHSRTSSTATSPRRNNHRRRIIRFNTRRLIIFQRITSHNVNQSLEIPLVHRANMLVENQRVPPTTARNILLNKNSETLISHNGVRELVSESPPTNNTSVMLSYL